MPKHRVFVLNGHPAEQSLNASLARAYAVAARGAGFSVRESHLASLTFDIDFGRAGYRDVKPLEPVLESILQSFEWADHIVLTMPMWWGGMPAKLKGLFDRILLPGRAFDPRVRDEVGMPKPLLTSKTARVIVTSDTPAEHLRTVYADAMLHQIRSQILDFVGIAPSEITYFQGASSVDEQTVKAWISELRELAQEAA